MQDELFEKYHHPITKAHLSGRVSGKIGEISAMHPSGNPHDYKNSTTGTVTGRKVDEFFGCGKVFLFPFLRLLFAPIVFASL